MGLSDWLSFAALTWLASSGPRDPGSESARPRSSGLSAGDASQPSRNRVRARRRGLPRLATCSSKDSSSGPPASAGQRPAPDAVPRRSIGDPTQWPRSRHPLEAGGAYEAAEDNGGAPVIRATCHTADDALTVEFDATPWFQAAAPASIRPASC